MAKVIISEPAGGEPITRGKHGLEVPDHPIIPYIRGDLIGSDITPVMLKVVDAAVEKAYGGRRRIHWLKLYAGDEAVERFHPEMTEEKLSAIPSRMLYQRDLRRDEQSEWDLLQLGDFPAAVLERQLPSLQHTLAELWVADLLQFRE